MPNLSKVYTQITRNPIVNDKPKEEVNPAEDAARQQALHNWKSSTLTKEKVEKLNERFQKLIKESMSLAISFPQHQNPSKIIHNLVEAETIYNLIQDYSL